MILKYNPIKGLYFNQVQYLKEREETKMDKVTKYSIKTTGAIHWKAIMAALLSTGFKYWNGDNDLENITNTGYGAGFNTYIIVKINNKTLSCANDNYIPYTDSYLTTLEDVLEVIERHSEPICCRSGIVHSDFVCIGEYKLTFDDILEMAEAVKKMQKI